MKTKEQIESKLKEVLEFETECEVMDNCVATGIHPLKYGYDFKTFADLDLAMKCSPGHWMQKSITYMKIAEALKWVLKN